MPDAAFIIGSLLQYGYFQLLQIANRLPAYCGFFVLNQQHDSRTPTPCSKCNP